MPFNYLNLQENYPKLSDCSDNLPNSGKEFEGEKEVDNKSLADELANGRVHDFHNDMTRICTCCGYCTSFGSRCCRCVSMDRSNDLGKICGCGKGDGGCKKCGLCRTCAEAIDSPQCPGPDHLYRLSNDGDRPNDEQNVLQVGSRIVSMWQREGGTQYPGKVIGVNNDGTYDIQYDDGDRDDGVPRRRISSITKIKQQQEPRARRIEDRSIRRQQINVSSPIRSEFRRFGMQSSNNVVNNDAANKELKSIERHLFQLARSLTGGLDLDWERDQLQESDNPLERLRNFGRNLSSSSRPTSTTCSSTSNHHPGLMQCKCNHAMGKLSYPLDPALFHLSGRCKWLCCGCDWNESCPINGSSTTKQSKDSSNLNYKVLSCPEIYNEFVDIPMTTADSNFGGNCNFITKLPPGYIAITL